MRAWQLISVFLLGKSHGQRSLVGYSPWGHTESDMTEWLSTGRGRPSRISLAPRVKMSEVQKINGMIYHISISIIPLARERKWLVWWELGRLLGIIFILSLLDGSLMVESTSHLPSGLWGAQPQKLSPSGGGWLGSAMHVTGRGKK